jgi:hypothetical protein
LESNGVQVVKDDFLILLVHLLLLPQNHIPLPLNRRRLQLRVLQNVGNDVDGLVHVLSEGLCVVHGLFAGGVSVQVSSEVLNLELKGVLRAASGT